MVAGLWNEKNANSISRSAVRKTEQAAFEMGARVFTGAPRPELFKPVTVSRTDWVLVTLFLVILAAAVLWVLY